MNVLKDDICFAFTYFVDHLVPAIDEYSVSTVILILGGFQEQISLTKVDRLSSLANEMTLYQFDLPIRFLLDQTRSNKMFMKSALF